MNEKDLDKIMQIIVLILVIIFCFWLSYEWKNQKEYVEKNIHKYPQCAMAKNISRCISLLETIE